ncbi:hypothetical protein M758_9G151700 [Ceratodon purpureus]|nr:hypothetical protein M758_9G151700 [Ceratodon purpureus]
MRIMCLGHSSAYYFTANDHFTMETSSLAAPLTTKLKECHIEETYFYEGCITDVSRDGTVDYRGRPADKATSGRWKAVSFIMGAVVLERLAYYGIASNLISYLTNNLHEVTVSVPGLKPPECITNLSCEPASKFQVRTFYIALYVVAVGVGGIKPCFSSLGADQFEEEDKKERFMKHSYFNYWWVAVTGGSFLALTVLVYLEDHVGYGWGYGIPTVGLAIAFAVFLLGTRTYRYKVPKGSPLTQVACVLVAALRNNNIQVPSDPSLLHEVVLPLKRNLRHTENLRFLDKAATTVTDHSTDDDDLKQSIKEGTPLIENKWRLCTVTEVEEVKLLARVIPVWFTTLVFMVTVQQMSTFFLRQGISMDQSMGPNFKIPPASLELACVVTALILIPLYDQYIVPYVRRFTGNERGFSLLQRLGVGLVITIFGMAVAASVEMRRLKVIKNNGLEYSELPIPMSVFWLVPQYSIMGIAQVFAYMGQLEFFYDQVPDDMQTIGTALFTSNTGVAHFVCASILQLVTSMTGRWSGQPWIVSNINQSRLDKYYWMLTVLSALNFVAFFLVSLGYTYKTAEPREPEHNKVVHVEPLLID